jgi:enoyl-CoA hydratase/carnithine racemase
LIVGKRVSEHVLLVTINREDKRNALHSTMVIELARRLEDAEHDVDVRCVVITGSEKLFSAGADIKELLEKGYPGSANSPERVKAWRIIEQFPKPIIAAVNGVAYGAGSELALVCDFIVAGKNATFAQPEVILGGMAGDGGTQRLPVKIGANMASYMMFTGLPIDAETAHRLGLVVEVCEVGETVHRAITIAEVIATRAPVSVQLTKACIRNAVGATRENGLAFEREALWRNSQSSDRKEGIKAFLEKRPPKFTGEW